MGYSGLCQVLVVLGFFWFFFRVAGVVLLKQRPTNPCQSQFLSTKRPNEMYTPGKRASAKQVPIYGWASDHYPPAQSCCKPELKPIA